MAGKSAAVRRHGGIHAAFLALLAVMVAMPLFAGCKEPDDGIPPAEKANADRLAQIAKASGGDFDRLTPADRDYLVNTIAHGNEQAARMMLMAKSGRRPGGGPPAPPGPPR